jgi:hypothetical protein
MSLIQSIPYPEYTTTNRDLLVDTIAGFIIYNTTISKYQLYNGSGWTDIFIAKEWEIFFAYIYDEIELIHETTTNITSVVLNHVTTLQYSIDDGGNWVTYTVPFTISVASSRWRVTAFSGSYISGSIIIKGN